MSPVSHKHAETKHAEIKRAVEKLFGAKPDWIKFYREVMGPRGLIRRMFPTFESMSDFEQTETYREIHRMLAELRKQPVPKELAEDTKVITVRIPESLHELLRMEAYEHRTTMNKLCISKLVQFIDTQNVPTVFEEKKPDLLGNEKTEAGL